MRSGLARSAEKRAWVFFMCFRGAGTLALPCMGISDKTVVYPFRFACLTLIVVFTLDNIIPFCRLVLLFVFFFIKV